MAVSQRPNTGPVYSAIEQWVDRCLREDGSLFSPALAVWTAENFLALLPLGTIEGADFEVKLHENLADSSAEVIQLAGEVLYVHLLMSQDMHTATKQALVRGVLALADQPVAMPPELDAALTTGLANTGIAYKTHRRSQFRMLIEFGHAWKQATADERETLLTEPWAFRNIALARALIDRHEVDHATFALCCPSGNRNIWRQWARCRRTFADVPDVTLVDLPADKVAAIHPPQQRDELRSRYQLDGD